MVLCPTCNTETKNKVLNTDGQTFSPYWACANCDLWFQNPLPKKVYEASHEKSPDGGFTGHLMSDYEKEINRNLAIGLYKEYVKEPGKHVLDVGSKYAYLSN